MLLAAIPVALVAGTLTIPNAFSNGTLADASAVNANFTAVKGAVDDNATRVAAIESTAAASKIWFYAHSGGTGGASPWANYSGFVPWGVVVPGSTGFTTNTTSAGGYFTAPVNGVYSFSATVLNYPSASASAQMSFSVDGATIDETPPGAAGTAFNFGFTRSPLAAQQTMHTNATIKLNAGQVVRLSVKTMYLYTSTGHCFFTGHLVFPTP